MGVLIVAVVVAAVITVASFVNKRNQDVNQAWQKVADTHGLTLRPASFGSGPRLSGFVNGHDLTIDIRKKGAGNQKSPWTRFRLGMPPLNLGIEIRNERFSDRFRRVFGTADIAVGDPTFDRNVMIKGRKERAVQRFLTPERRRPVAHFLASFADASITDDEISMSSRGYARKHGDVLAGIDAMLIVAEALAGDAGPAVDRMRPDDAQIPAGEAARLTDDPEVPPDAEVPPDTEAPTDAESAADNAEVSPDMGHVPPDVPPDDEAPPDAAETEPDIPAPPPVGPDAAGIDPATFCGVVFAPGMLSFASTQAFRQNFEGRQIHWTGTLETVTPFSYDFDFGSQGGLKAVFALPSADSAGGREPKAVIGLPGDAGDLEQRIGQAVAFTGRLIKVDGLARKIFVAEAAIVD